MSHRIGLKVDKKNFLFRLPLSSAEDIDHLIFCCGLSAHGVIAPNLASSRPRITRRPLYSYRSLPKALYLFLAEEKVNELDDWELQSFLLRHADSYLFEWKLNYHESSANARGSVPTFELERDQRYVHSDDGSSWIHDPVSRRIDNTKGTYRLAAEDLNSGMKLLDNAFKLYQREVDRLRSTWIASNEVFRFLPERSEWKMWDPRCEIIEIPDEQSDDREDVSNIAEWYRQWAYSNLPDGAVPSVCRDETAIYKPFYVDGLWLTYSQIEDIELNICGFAHRVDDCGLDALIEREGSDETAFFTRAGPGGPRLSCERVDCCRIYPDLPLAYFIAGIEASRPHARALGLYQVLEYEIRKRQRGGRDKAAIKRLVMDKSVFPDEVLDQAHRIALGGQEDVHTFKGKNGNLDRGRIGESIYQMMRNPIVHAGQDGSDSVTAIPPYAPEQFSSEFTQLVTLTRELARHLVHQSGHEQARS